ncbi:terminase small subunit [candidate division KSB1 bacterium]|nr:terminase small subunit [candidate division KSB1 bacterium]
MTVKQKKFIDEYLACNNATQAAIRAGYSLKSARQIGTENLSKPSIRQIIDRHQLDMASEAGVTAERIVLETKRIAFADPRELFKKSGYVLVDDPSKLPDDIAAAISGIDIITNKDGDTTYKIRFWNKNQALELLAKYLGMLTGKGENVTEETGVIMMPEKKEPGASVE